MYDTPSIWVPLKGAEDNRIHIKMPYAPDNRHTLRRALGKGCRLQREGGYWKVSRTNVRAICYALVDRYPEVYMYRDYNARSKCDTRCREAVGDECECSCLGANHSMGYLMPWEIRVGDTTILSNEVRRVLRVLTKRNYNEEAA